MVGCLIMKSLNNRRIVYDLYENIPSFIYSVIENMIILKTSACFLRLSLQQVGSD